MSRLFWEIGQKLGLEIITRARTWLAFYDICDGIKSMFAFLQSSSTEVGDSRFVKIHFPFKGFKILC